MYWLDPWMFRGCSAESKTSDAVPDGQDADENLKWELPRPYRWERESGFVCSFKRFTGTL
jgi:hypothetical protein